MGKINADTEAIQAYIKQLKVFIKQEISLISNLNSKYKAVGQRWSDLQYQRFKDALVDNEKKTKALIQNAETQVGLLEKKLVQLQTYLSTTEIVDSSTGKSSGIQDVSLEQHTLFELEVLRDDLELTEGDPNVPQLGGAYGKIRGVLPGFEAHHIPSKAVQNENELLLPAIAMTSADHALTDSYRGKQKHIVSTPWYQGTETYRNEAANLIDTGDYIRLVRYELLNIRDRCGHRYDGAISQYLDALKVYIENNGIPSAVYD